MLEVTITDAQHLMRQTGMTADEYMNDAKARIDLAFGKSFAATHPKLVAAFMRTAAEDFHTSMMKAAAQDIRDALSGISDALTTSDPLRNRHDDEG